DLTPAAKAEAWQLLVGEPEPENWRHRAVLGGFWHPAQLAVTEPYVAKFHQVADDIWERRSGALAREFLRLGYPGYHVSEETVAMSEAWLADESRPAPARRLLAQRPGSPGPALAARAG